MKLVDVQNAQKRLEHAVLHTPLMRNRNFSTQHNANIFLKREDMQVVRSYKIRGAYNKISQLEAQEKEKGIVCASAGNHAQGVALACAELSIRGVIFMPLTTPKQKVTQVKLFGNEWIEIRLEGDSFDDASKAAKEFCMIHGSTFVHPFDDKDIIAGQGTVGLEILEDSTAPIDILLVPIGGGGLAAGISVVFNALSPTTRIIGVEPAGAPSMKTSLMNQVNTTLEKIDTFVDGASVKRIGELNFEICQKSLEDVLLVPEGKVCTTILQLYNSEGIIVEPAGALTLAALDLLDPEDLKGKNVVCIVSGSNNDITRTEEIKERSMVYEGLKHYFLVEFPQRPGALKEFVTDVISDTDDITFFQFSKKNNRENGPAVVGIELKESKHFEELVVRMNQKSIDFTYLNDTPLLLTQLIG
jgi:threonine dehydratase